MSPTARQRLEQAIAVLANRVQAPPAIGSPEQLAFRLGIELDLWQRGFLRSDARQILLNASRQAGKSTLSAVIGLHEALTVPGALILIVSPTERQSKLLFRKLMTYFRQLGEPVPATIENKLSLELVNGSEVHALPGAEGTIRGFSAVTLLLIDEASRVDDALLIAVRPMLAVSGGRLIALSTPFGRRGWFFESWVNGGGDWQRIEVKATDVPRISPTFLEAERRAMPDMFFRSEYLCEFVANSDSYFRPEDIDRAFVGHITPLFSEDEYVTA